MPGALCGTHGRQQQALEHGEQEQAQATVQDVQQQSHCKDSRRGSEEPETVVRGGGGGHTVGMSEHNKALPCRGKGKGESGCGVDMQRAAAPRLNIQRIG